MTSPYSVEGASDAREHLADVRLRFDFAIAVTVHLTPATAFDDSIECAVTVILRLSAQSP
jgi:hypothetical protein